MARITSLLASVTFALAAVACGECDGSQARREEAPLEAAAPVADAGPIDDVFAVADGACESSFVKTSDCAHPNAVSDCRAGFCTIPAGCFVSGSPECQASRGANTERETQVTLTHPFEIAEHETTQAEWTEMGFPNPSVGPRPTIPTDVGSCLEPTCPVAQVSWFEALAYANARSLAHVPALPACYELQGCTGAVGTKSMTCTGVRQTMPSIYDCEGYRLPTDAEWEYAARAGTRTPYYSGPMVSTSDRCEDEAALSGVAWYCSNFVNRSTSPVGRKAPNGWGLFDMLGNEAELASDEYTGLPPSEVVVVDPGSRLGTKPERPKRGGSILGWPNVTTVSYRLGRDWNDRDSTLGFRLVRTLK